MAGRCTGEWAVVVRGRRGRGLRCHRRGGRAELRGDRSADARAMAGPRAHVIDLKGRLAIPAFGAARPSRWWRPRQPPLQSRRPAQPPRIPQHDRQIRRTLGPDDWVLGGGWSLEAFPGGIPSAADLEAVAPGRPVFLPNRDHHSAWVSQAALTRAGITRDVPDPSDGRIERDERGEPSGALHDGAMRLVSRVLPPRRPPIWPPGSARARPTCTRSASRTGRTPSLAKPQTSASPTVRDLPRRRGRRLADRARQWGPVVGPDPRRRPDRRSARQA